MSIQHSPVNNFNASAVQDYLVKSYDSVLADAQTSRGINHPSYPLSLSLSSLLFTNYKQALQPSTNPHPAAGPPPNPPPPPHPRPQASPRVHPQAQAARGLQPAPEC